MQNCDSKIASEVCKYQLPRENARVIGPDTYVTLDYIPNRLNIQKDKNDRIYKVSLG